MEEMAEVLARNSHLEQMYGNQPYSVHLEAVVQVLKDVGATEPVALSAAWLHDVIEDTGLTREDIAGLCGDEVAEIVWACTGVGKNRRERNQSVYDKIAALPKAAVVKVADRIANVEASRGKPIASMYDKERQVFNAKVGVYVDAPLWSRLQSAYRDAA